MVQTQIISSDQVFNFDEMLNAFLKKLDEENFEVIDIKYQTSVRWKKVDYNRYELGNAYNSALVLFKKLEVTPAMLGEDGR